MKQTAAATEACKRYSAERAAHNPVKLDKAARIVRAALAAGALTLADLQGDIVRPGRDGGGHGERE